MFQTFKNAWRIPELRKKILFTFLIIVLYRIGSNIPVPYVNGEAINGWFTSTAGSSILTYFNILSGSALSYGTLFALSVSPYITASIVVQLLCVAIPALERWSKDEAGRKKVNILKPSELRRDSERDDVTAVARIQTWWALVSQAMDFDICLFFFFP